MSKAAEASGNLKKLIGDERANKMGNYTESTGGGTPIPKGEKLKDHPEAKRVTQPRDEEGKFTYNAVNFKTLKYGPSRGKTVPPFLRGLHLDTNLISANGKVITDGKRWNISGLEMNKQELLNNFKEFRGNEEGFGDFEKAKFSGVRGRPSKQEKEIMNSGKAHGYFEDTKDLGQYNSTQDLQDNMKKLRREQENRKFRKTLLGIQGKLGEKGINKSIPEIKEMMKSGEVENILGPNYMGDVHKGLIKNKKSNKDENTGQAQDTNPESGVDKQNNQETPQNGSEVSSEVGEENNNTNQEQSVSSDTANNDVPAGGENNEVPETPQENTAEKGVQKNEMPTGGGDTPSGNGNIGELNKAQDNSLETENSNMNNDTSSNPQQEELSGAGNSQQEENNSSNGEVGGFEDIEDNSNQNEQDMSNAGNDVPSQNSAIFSKNDLEMASKNQSGFYNKYRSQIDGLVKYAEKLGFKGLNKFEIMKKIASGKYKTLKSFEDALVANYKKHNNGQTPEAYTGPGSEKIQKTVNNSVVGETDKKAEGAGSKGSFKAKVDKKLAKTNKVEWVNQNRANITKLIDYCDNTLDMPDISPKRIANMAASGMFKTFEEIKEYFDDKYEIETGERPILNQFAQRNAETEKQIGKTIED